MKHTINGKTVQVVVLEKDITGSPTVIEIQGVIYRRQAKVMKAAKISNRLAAEVNIITGNH